MISQKGQIMIEFFLYGSVFMFLVISGYFVISFIQGTETSTRESVLIKEVSDNFEKAIELSVNSGEGFTYNLNFPKTILSKPYTIVFNPEKSIAVMTWEGSYASFSYSLRMPAYDYVFEGCLKPPLANKIPTFTSNQCLSTLEFSNNGTAVIVIQKQS